MARKRKNNRQKRLTPPKDARDYGTPEFREKVFTTHGDELPIVKEGDERHLRNYTQVPIDFYFRAGLIDYRQWDAGNRLFRLWYHGAPKIGFTSVNLMNLGIRGTSPDRMKITAEIAQDYRNAMNATGDTFTQLAVFNVVCIGEWAKYLRSIPARRRMDTLIKGLDLLADHFHIPKHQADTNASPQSR